MKRHHPAIIGAMLSLALPLQAAKLDVDPERSRIQIDCHATGHDFTATLDRYEVSATGIAASLAPESFALKWKFSDLHTGDKKRDHEMIQWLEDASPKGSFKFIKSWTDEKGGLHAMGTLTVHGVAKQISFPYTVKKEGEWVTIDGTAAMNYSDFKLPLIRAMAVMTVDPKLSVRFHVVGTVK